jgi:hypothetical protein
MWIIKKLKEFDDWFDLNLGWFFTNGGKMEEREKRLREKYGSGNNQ